MMWSLLSEVEKQGGLKLLSPTPYQCQPMEGILHHLQIIYQKIYLLLQDFTGNKT